MPEQQQRARPRGGRKGRPGVPAAPAERRVGLDDRLDALRADPAARKQLSQRVEDYRRADVALNLITVSALTTICMQSSACDTATPPSATLPLYFSRASSS